MQSEVSLKTDRKPTFRDKLWLLLEVPTSSLKASRWHSTTLFMALSSIALFYSETLPEFQNYGIGTTVCKLVAETYCGGGALDPGCFVQNDGFVGKNIDYNCRDEPHGQTCYGVGKNFGSPDWHCDDAFGLEGQKGVCNRRQCDENHVMKVDAAAYWPYFEWAFGIFFSIELVVRFCVSRSPGLFFKDTYNLIDAACVLPFYVEVRQW